MEGPEPASVAPTFLLRRPFRLRYSAWRSRAHCAISGAGRPLPPGWSGCRRRVTNGSHYRSEAMLILKHRPERGPVDPTTEVSTVDGERGRSGIRPLSGRRRDAAMTRPLRSGPTGWRRVARAGNRTGPVATTNPDGDPAIRHHFTHHDGSLDWRGDQDPCSSTNRPAHRLSAAGRTLTDRLRTGSRTVPLTRNASHNCG